MSTKLTLSIDEKVVAEAKEYARESGKSLSKLIEGYLRGLKKDSKKSTERTLSPVLKRLHGCIKESELATGKDDYAAHILNKYA
ncbi:MAG: hypothetical protein K2X37_09785 [Chitinophagaceae bacterium]|nr:hypothetical protein [Chitinophagaceae bacterium]